MTRFGMVIDLDLCSGCAACSVACSTECNLPFGSAEEAAAGRLMRWLQVLPRVEGQYPRVHASLQPMMCQQCDKAPCTLVCPVSATYVNPQGIVAQVYWRCVGCRYCVNACPYTLKWFNWKDHEWPGATLDATNPDVEVREKGVTEKCCFCSHRLQRAKEAAKAEGRPIGADEYVPACVEACPTGGMVFGDLDDPESEVARRARDPRAYKVLEELGTAPKVIYLKST